MFAPGYHYHLLLSKKPVARPPSKEALTQFFWKMWKEDLKWLQSQLSVIKSTGVASGSVAMMSLYVGNFVWVEAAHKDLQSIVVLCLFSTFSVMKTFVSSHLILFPLSTIAEPHWLVVVMVCLVKEPLLIGLLVFV